MLTDGRMPDAGVTGILLAHPLGSGELKMVFKTNNCLMQLKSIAEYFKWSILQYF